MWRLAFIPLIFACATAILLHIVASLPKMKSKEVISNKDDDVIISDFDPDEVQPVDIRSHLKFPRNLEELRTLSFDLADYKDEHFAHVTLFFPRLRVQTNFLHSWLGLLELVGRPSIRYLICLSSRLYLNCLWGVFRIPPFPLFRFDVRPSFLSPSSGPTSATNIHGTEKRKPLLVSPLPPSLSRITQLVAQYLVSAGRRASFVLLPFCGVGFDPV